MFLRGYTVCWTLFGFIFFFLVEFFMLLWRPVGGKKVLYTMFNSIFTPKSDRSKRYTKTNPHNSA